MEKKYTHKQTLRNINNFMKSGGVSLKTKKSVNDFFVKLRENDPLDLTEFELSFKVKDRILNNREIRILNLDSKAYSYASQKAYLSKLLAYKKIIWEKTKNPLKKKIFAALESISFHPMDFYVGADIKDENYLFAFWLILGGVEQSGKINFVKNPEKVLDSIFKVLGIKPAYKINPMSVLNFGFDLGGKEAFYKIYYILNKENAAHISAKEKKTVSKIVDFLGKKYRHWFFVSERYTIDDDQNDLKRKKVYLEFLDIMRTNDEKTHKMLSGIFDIVGCPFSQIKIKNTLGVLDGRVVIIAFEEDGTVTFYIRI